MALNWDYVRQEINLGIKAHKVSDNVAAWLHFQAALREDTQNVTALLWLAYISKDYEKRIFLLSRVLEIEPDNQRARSGLNWAEQENKQLETASTPDADKGQTKKTPATSKDIAALNQRFKKAIGDDDLKKQAEKGTIAQRTRRRISPL